VYLDAPDHMGPRGFFICRRSLAGAGNNLAQLRVQLAVAKKAEDEAAVVELSRRILEITPNDSGLWEKRARKQLNSKTMIVVMRH